VLLKHLQAYPQHVTAHRIEGPQGAATLVALDTAASAYDRQAYPTAARAILIASDHPDLTAALLGHVPRGTGLVFKLASDADRPVVATEFAIERRTGFISFTGQPPSPPADGVRLTTAPGDAAFRLFESQGHARDWLVPLLTSGRAFACLAERDGDVASACLAFEAWDRVWEVGGVVTLPSARKQGLGSAVVGTALAALTQRGLTPRYQVEEHNAASIALAHSVGLAPFLTLTHWAHAC
jgi:GNAT superfamily N-acetyltransferase